MIYPIVAYGDDVLRKKTEDIDPEWEELPQLIEDMFETMRAAQGVGLAAPQIGKSLRLFVVDASPFAEDEEFAEENLDGFTRVFVNPKIVQEKGDPWKFEEGCLSIPSIREDVQRKDTLTIEYLDEKLQKKEEEFSGIAARIIQHEYDHIEGVLFIDHISPIRKRFIKKKLQNISKGAVPVGYKMKFPLKK